RAAPLHPVALRGPQAAVITGHAARRDREGPSGMSRVADHHEFGARAVTTETSSDRSFGLVFAGFFALLSGYNWWHGGRLYWLWLAVAVVFLALALTVAHLLAPLHRALGKGGPRVGL